MNERPSSKELSSATKLVLYRKMFLSRKSEEKIQEEYKNNEMKTPMHMSMGEEAIAAGVCAALGKKVQIFSTYRTHAAYLASTEDAKSFFAELYGKDSGPGGGKGGSMHLADPDKGVIFSSAVVGTNIPSALGAAFANRHFKNKKIAVAFFGDGAVDEGVFWESINMALLWKLPVLFVYEDNGFAIHTPASLRHGYKDLAQIIKSFGYQVVKYSGTDVEEIFQLVRSSLKHLDDGPLFLSLKYYRYLEHVGTAEDFSAGYRDKKEFLKWHRNDPVKMQRDKLVKLGLASKVLKLEKEILDKISKAVSQAKTDAFPNSKQLYFGVYENEREK